MDENWLTSLERSTCVIVPTRTLQTELQSQVASEHIRSGKEVWESANILTWNDYLDLHWLANRSQIEGATTLIDATQSRLLWERVIEQTQRQDDELALLNVQQTARAALRSWRLVHDWQLSLSALATSMITDTYQFSQWCTDYQTALGKLNLLDTAVLFTQLRTLAIQSTLRSPFNKLIWHGFDLITAAQRSWQASTSGIDHQISQAVPAQGERSYVCYAIPREEYIAVLNHARNLIEQDPNLQINIVIPNLQEMLPDIEAYAASVFYPSRSPLELQDNDLAYRFSLGKPIADWAAATAALKVLKCLQGRVSTSDLSWLLRNQFLRQCRNIRQDSLHFEKWLLNSRIDQILLTKLPELALAAGLQGDSKLTLFFQGLVDFNKELEIELNKQAHEGRYRTLKPARWREVFNDWLAVWGWSTATDSGSLSSSQYQLLERWQQLMKTFDSFVTVQSRFGLRRALDLLQAISRDEVFLPKASNAPVVISGVYEALGASSDVCFLLGMNEKYPTPARVDPFIAVELRASDLYPSTTPVHHMEQADKVIKSLLGGAQQSYISYSKQDIRDPSIELGVASMFRHESFSNAIESTPESVSQALEKFIDTQGPQVANVAALRGGTSIFTHQSNCAFKAFATHRLACSADAEPEFGLDPLDRGNVVHDMLERCWQQLQSKAELDAVIEKNRLEKFISNTVEATLCDYAQDLSEQKAQLLQLEKTRLHNLLREWLELESRRPADFGVAAVEEQGEHQLGGIRFSYKIDRIDFTEEGQTVVMDYKTGVVSRKDLHGDRIRQPQLPLYVQAVTARKHKAPVGVAFAQVKQNECKLEELSEAGIFQRQASHAAKHAELWSHASAQWPSQLEQLASDFLAGVATVNPIDTKTCQFCDLQALCRINQMRPAEELEARDAE